MYAVWAYRNFEFLSVKKLHECNLFSKSRTSEQSLILLYLVHSVSTDTIMIQVCEGQYTI
jgi:hypothetical protein